MDPMKSQPETPITRFQLADAILRHSTVIYNLAVQEGAPPPSPSAARASSLPYEGVLRAISTLATTGCEDVNRSKVVAATATIQVLLEADGVHANVTVSATVTPTGTPHSTPPMDSDYTSDHPHIAHMAVSQNQQQREVADSAVGFTIQTIKNAQSSVHKVIQKSHALPLKTHLEDVVSFMNQDTNKQDERAFRLTMVARCYPMTRLRLRKKAVLKSNLDSVLETMKPRDTKITLGEKSYAALCRAYYNHDVTGPPPELRTLSTSGVLLDVLTATYRRTCTASAVYQTLLDQEAVFTEALAATRSVIPKQQKRFVNLVSTLSLLYASNPGLLPNASQPTEDAFIEIFSEIYRAGSERKATARAAAKAASELPRMRKEVFAALEGLNVSLGALGMVSSLEVYDQIFCDPRATKSVCNELNDRAPLYAQHNEDKKVAESPTGEASKKEGGALKAAGEDEALLGEGIEDDEKGTTRPGLQLLHHIRKMAGVIRAVSSLIQHKRRLHRPFVSHLRFVSVNGFEASLTEEQSGIKQMVLDEAEVEKLDDTDFKIWVEKEIPDTLSCKGSVHCESALMTVYYGCREYADGKPIEAHFKKLMEDMDDKQREIFSLSPTTFVAAKKPCALCKALATELGFTVPESHGKYFSWIPPPGLPLLVLQTLLKKLEDRFKKVVHEISWASKASISRSSSPALSEKGEEVIWIDEDEENGKDGEDFVKGALELSE